ncbi:BTB POZ domain-containing 6 isoform X4 [Paramuricea clavata]|uniref:BTB POZ domain-containing 6 isoform X4 n=1 Tax=Paramuricea clavata TaxID=317549 RepID=A0A7D9E3L2_PARCT|nr:BTB POZ domain-containing 6 isoform X4 [Paramuricea clavata]
METSNTKWQSNTLVERNKYMYNNSFTSDVKFTFGNNQSGEVFFAHKYVLATSSPVFYEIFYSKSGKNIMDIHIPHSDNETVADFFGFLYNGKCPTATNVAKDLPRLLRLVMHYQVTSFDAACKNYLKPTQQQAFKFLEQFLELKAERSISTCFDYIDKFANRYFTSEYFLNIKLGTLDALLRRDTLDYREVKLFKAVVKWVDHQCSVQNLEASYENRRKILGNVIYNIRFLLMTLDEFTTDVIGVDILSDHESFGIIKAITGYHVQDLVWDSPGLRRQRNPEDGNWWAYFRHAVALFTIGIVGVLIGLCMCCAHLLNKIKNAIMSEVPHKSCTESKYNPKMQKSNNVYPSKKRLPNHEPNRENTTDAHARGWGTDSVTPPVYQSNLGSCIIHGGCVLLASGGVCVLSNLNELKNDQVEELGNVVQTECVNIDVPKKYIGCQQSQISVPVTCKIWACCEITKKQGTRSHNTYQNLQEYGQLSKTLVDYFKNEFFQFLHPLKSMMSLAEAHAKLNLRHEVSEDDAVMAILLYEESITARVGYSVLGVSPVHHFKDGNIMSYIGEENDEKMTHLKIHTKRFCSLHSNYKYIPGYIPHEE